ncbi:hypothetical protein CPB83DRAFT_890678 [Crepidotus variabilis]|uniref:Uncharacterized protein n=1 Tax=Crepidotus variabilis TaxID=179855 RepID=A0A9P6JTK2_9AGAR|nr:hypothetical protein CPB83DRAFT_890678 [Crepidotus variabilis]
MSQSGRSSKSTATFSALPSAAYDSRDSGSSSPSASGNSTPTRKLISEPFCDPIELMANRLAEELELFGLGDFSSSSDADPFALCSVPQPNYRAPSLTRSSSRRRSSSTTLSIHTRSRSGSLTAIPEED